MALHEYNVKASGRRGGVDTTMLLSDEDAKSMGLTAKDRVSKTDQSVTATNEEFQPATEADLDPNAAAAAAAALEAAQAEEKRVADENAAKVEAARVEAERAAAAEKEAAKTANKAAAAPKNKSAAPADSK